MARIGGKEVYFRRRGKEGTIYAQITLPHKEGGRISDLRVERSTGTADQRQAEKFAKAMILAAYEAITQPEPVKAATERLFGQALAAYEAQTKDKRFLLPLLDEIGTMPLSEVTQEVVDNLAAKLYPRATAATRNRQVYTPVGAILKMAETPDYRPPRLKRPKGYLPPSNFVAPPKDWWKRVIEVSEPNLAAILWFWRLIGRRTTEACQIKPEHVDRDTWRVEVWDGKGKQKIMTTLPEEVIEQLRKYEWWKQKYVFGFSSRARVYPKLKAACKRAGVPYSRPKDSGRHSWASYFLEQGGTLKELKEAGRWKTIKVPDMIYGHLEHSKVDAQARQISENWAKEQAGKGEVIKPDFSANQRQDKK
ncbi:MAG: tyrosine-type recombinase/integrase [Rhodomicrobium sp.]